MRSRIILAMCLALAWCALATAIGPQTAEAGVRVDRLRERLHLLDGYLEHYANDHFNLYPPAPSVRKGGIRAPVWPTNPWTKQPMKPGTGAGDFTYWVAAGRLRCRLTGHYPGGTIVVRSRVPYSRKMQNDHRTMEGAQLLQRFADEWARRHGGRAPTAAEMAPNGAVGKLRSIAWWPHNPWNHERMHQGTWWGEFTYEVDATTGIYTIKMHKSRGGAYWLRGPFKKTLASAVTTTEGTAHYRTLGSRLSAAISGGAVDQTDGSAALAVAGSPSLTP